MKYLIFCFISFFQFLGLGQTYSQGKPALNLSTFNAWPSIGPARISNDGTTVGYTIQNEPAACNSLIFYKVNSNAEIKIISTGRWANPIFTSDSKFAIFKNTNDSLGVLSLETMTVDYIVNVQSFANAIVGGHEWLVFCQSPSPDELKLHNLSTREDTSINNVDSYWFNKNGDLMLVDNSSKKEGESGLLEVTVLNLHTGFKKGFHSISEYRLTENERLLVLKRRPVNGACDKQYDLIAYDFTLKRELVLTNVLDHLVSRNTDMILLRKASLEAGCNTDSLGIATFSEYVIGYKTLFFLMDSLTTFGTFDCDKKKSALAFFLSQDQQNRIAHSLWYYKMGSKEIKLALSDSSAIGRTKALDPGFILFSKNSNLLFLYFTELETSANKSITTRVNVWSYRDVKLQSQQLKEPKPSKNSLYSYDPDDHALVLLTSVGDRYTLNGNEDSESVVCISNPLGIAPGGGEHSWNKAAFYDVFIIDPKSGRRKLIKSNCQVSLEYSLAHKYIVYYDTEARNYFSINLSNGALRNISQKISSPLVHDSNGMTDPPDIPYGLLGWFKNDSALLLYDQFDIWKVDPDGKKPPICITNQFGRRNELELRLIFDHSGFPFESNEKVILSAFNNLTKENGFYSLKIDFHENPIKLSMTPHLYYAPTMEFDFRGRIPVKANNSERYLIVRESASESPNYFTTTDFNSFQPISSVYPEKKFNWLTTELHTWRMFDGRVSQGILYKPENFDSTKKYPLIFYFYERLSDGLNNYLRPKPSDGTLNISWFVSNGYLVFCPDIYYKLGKLCESAYNSVVSAAKYISKLKFVDSNRLGIQGHSFGGYQANCLVTQTGIFAAACSAAGLSDIVSKFGGLREGSWSGQYMHQERTGGTLWDKPSVYIKNSPVFFAPNVTTPLLMFATSFDGAVDFSQAIEFFAALRRLGKKVWLLEYNDGNHGVSGNSAIDFTIRMTQFFDHYLKSKPSPKWMTRGIPGYLKGKMDGLELDSEIKTPGEGVLTPAEYKRIDNLRKRKLTNISLE